MDYSNYTFSLSTNLMPRGKSEVRVTFFYTGGAAAFLDLQKVSMGFAFDDVYCC